MANYQGESVKSRGSVSDCETRGRALPSPLRSPVLGSGSQGQAGKQFRFRPLHQLVSEGNRNRRSIDYPRHE